MEPGERAAELLGDATSNPRRAFQDGQALLADIDDVDHVNRSIVLRALGIAARLADTMQESIQFARRSVAEAEEAGDAELRAEALMSLAASYAISGDSVLALDALARAEEGSEDLLAAQVSFQKAAVLSRLGRYEEATLIYGEVLPIFMERQDARFEALTRQNLGRINMISGRLDEAETELLRARGLFEELELETPIAAVDHGLGVLASYRGDLVGALRLLDESERRYGELVDAVAEIQVSRCEVLLSAGLVSESARLAGTIAQTLQDLGLGEDEAEARLIGAQATLAAGDRAQARERAMRARDLFAVQQRDTWQAQAEHVEIAALLEDGAIGPELLGRARGVAERLGAEHQVAASLSARLTAASIAIELGDFEAASRELASVAGVKTGTVEMRLQSWLAEAMLHELKGDRRRAMAAARSGMEMLDRYQAALGASDIRAGIETHARQLGELGLRIAVESGDARSAFQWMERTKARSLRTRPVTPPTDDELLGHLADLRQVTVKIRGATGAEADELRRWERSLQEAIRRRTRMLPGKGPNPAPGEPADLVPGQLEEGTLIEFATVGDQLWSVSVTGDGFELRHSGSVSDAGYELESLRFLLRRLARRSTGGDQARRVAARLDELVFGDLDPGGEPAVIVPTPGLYATPWSILPSLRGRPVTVAPSAELWVKRKPMSGIEGRVVVAAGPGLEQAESEVEAVSRLYEGAAAWGPGESKVEEIITALDGAAAAHIASHAFFQYENPMFSSIRLADGDVFVYDFERLRRSPRLMVLSACDSGFSESRAGEELLGLSASLLAMGTGSVVASIGLVPDSKATRELMVEFHRGLLEGLGPTRSLSRAQDRIADAAGGFVAAASFICIGGG